MNILDTDWGHVLAIVGVLISIGMDACIAIIAWKLLRWHHGDGIRLAALEAWQLAKTQGAADEAAATARQASPVAHPQRRASDRVGPAA